VDLGPIAGIRSISLLNARKTESEGTPHFEIDAAERSGDDSYSASGENGQPESEHPSTEAIEASAESGSEEAQPNAALEEHRSWFV
jgi:hypothetical protein